MLRPPAEALAAVLCLALPVQAQAQEAAAPFHDLWADFLGACGPLLADPDSGLDGQRRFTGYPMAAWNRTQDGAEATAEHYADDMERSIGWHLMRSDRAYSLFCEVHGPAAPSGDVAELAKAIRALFEDSGSMTVSGGLSATVAGSHPDLVGMENGARHAFVVDGAFAEISDAAVQVYLDSGIVSATVYSSWAREP